MARIYSSRRYLLAHIARFYDAGIEGLLNKMLGVAKRGALLEKALGGLRASGQVGVNRQEELAVLSVDIRGSSKLAERLSADQMFLVFQCYLPLMVVLTEERGGDVVGLRGDGVLSAFGIGQSSWKTTVEVAYETGMAMLEVTTDLLTPFLRSKGIPVELVSGCAIDIGKVTVTKIGFRSTVEVTAYGPAVNWAAKQSKGENSLWLSGAARMHYKGVGKEKEVRRSYTRLVD